MDNTLVHLSLISTFVLLLEMIICKCVSRLNFKSFLLFINPISSSFPYLILFRIFQIWYLLMLITTLLIFSSAKLKVLCLFQRPNSISTVFILNAESLTNALIIFSMNSQTNLLYFHPIKRCSIFSMSPAVQALQIPSE